MPNKELKGQLMDVIRNDNTARMRRDVFTPMVQLVIQDISGKKQVEIEKIINTAIKKFGLLKCKIDFGKLSDKEIRQLGCEINKKISEKICLYTSKFSNVELLSALVRLSGLLSYLTLEMYYPSTREDFLERSVYKGHVFQDIIAFMAQAIRSAEIHGQYDGSQLLGGLKASVELGINQILKGELSSANCNQYENLHLLELMNLWTAQVQLSNIFDSLIIAGSLRKGLILEEGKLPEVPMSVSTAFSKYAEDTKSYSIKIHRKAHNKALKRFKEIVGYSPDDFRRYLEDDNKVFQMNNFATILDDGFLETELELKKIVPHKGAKRLVSDITLNNQEFYVHGKNALDYMSDPNFRFFRSPLIRIEGKILTSPITMVEVTEKLRLRVLSRSFQIEEGANFNEVAKINFDEESLPKIKKALQNIGVKALTDFDIGRNPFTKLVMQNKRGIPHQLDLCYVKQGELSIWDLKNYELQHSYIEFERLKNKITKEVAKLRKLKIEVLKNKAIFEQAFGVEFKTVSLGIMTVDPSAYPYLIENKNNKVKVTSVNDFIQNLVANT
ncbi:hypothetical protein [Lacticaseibacillus rhamnosus]|uniref:hypothetical protein n=1 Tax=Lacticaseibacillus rhamnosus TaxID=47715 RepID=UPI00237EFDFC|nr:hypothetical protein [Lacticaseibacillus rhamnosus]MDE3295565.1 hypothetical protein [Lacticaseibacillus rhamnosus]